MNSYPWLAGVYDRIVFTAFDTETTGLDPEENRILEIGAVKFDYRGIIARFNVLVNPAMEIPEETIRVHNITQDMVADKPLINDIFSDFFRFIAHTVLIAHNANFDIGFINAELARNSKTPLTHKVVDTLVFSREVYPGLPKYTLQDLAQRFGISVFNAHRAEDDARVCMDLFLRILQDFIKNNPELVADMRAEVDLADYIKTKNPQNTEEHYIQNLF